MNQIWPTVQGISVIKTRKIAWNEIFGWQRIRCEIPLMTGNACTMRTCFSRAIVDKLPRSWHIPFHGMNLGKWLHSIRFWCGLVSAQVVSKWEFVNQTTTFRVCALLFQQIWTQSWSSGHLVTLQEMKSMHLCTVVWCHWNFFWVCVYVIQHKHCLAHILWVCNHRSSASPRIAEIFRKNEYQKLYYIDI